MPIKLVNRTVLHCKCRHADCLHEWDTFSKPKRCARCKRYSWNGEDYRRIDPFELVPNGSVIDAVPEPPRYKQVVEALTEAKDIIDQIISDYGPCDHGKKICVCPEIAVRAKVEKQIEALKKYLAPAAVAKNGSKEKAGVGHKD